MLRSAAEQWSTHGVEAEILAVAEVPGPYADELREAGYVVGHESDRALRRVPARLRTRVAAGRYDIVHLHAERGNFWFALAARSAGADVVRTVHNNFSFSGKLALERTVQRGLLRVARVGAHVAVGSEVAENEWRRFRSPAQVVDNWYDPVFVPPELEQRRRARAAMEVGDAETVLVSVGNCSPVKRHDAVLAALAHPRCPSDMRYLHVGEEAEDRPERALAERLGLADRVRFLGRVHALPILHAADVFVMPSRYEGMSIAAVEALATGLPAVLADAPGLRELASVSEAVTLADTDPGTLADALASAARRSKKRSRSDGVDAVEKIRLRYGMTRGVAEYAEVYQRLVTR
ncbi:glycosyltransferase [Streptomyces beijiangensis]